MFSSSNIMIIAITMMLYSCSSPHIRDIDPREYEFETEYAQRKWNFFLELNSCEKVEYLDSLMRPILLRNIEIYNSKNKLQTNTHIDTLLNNKNSPDNFYYWVFREVHRLTNHHPSIFVHHFGYLGITNVQITPSYSISDSLLNYNYDIKSWKDSLGCE